MDIVEAITSRRSIRGYKPDAVPREILKEILEVASHAPSSMNTQPWECTVIAGEVMEKIKQANMAKRDSGESPKAEVSRIPYIGKYNERQIAMAVQLLQALHINRDDKEKRDEWLRKGFRFFDAPAAIIISIDESLKEASEFDLGVIAQTIALAAMNYGLGTCMQQEGILYPDVIRKFTGIPESKRISICLTIGYPDWDFPTNKVRCGRESIENFTTWCGI